MSRTRSRRSIARFHGETLSLVLAASTLLALSACGGGSPADATITPDGNTDGGVFASLEAAGTGDSAPGSEGDLAAARGTVELDGETHEFTTSATFCTIDESDEIPVRATFGDEALSDPNVDALLIGRAGSSDTRIIVELGERRWDTRLSDPPRIADGTATWDSLMMGRVDGTGEDTLTITVSCG
jgi:hypothetical protein